MSGIKIKRKVAIIQNDDINGILFNFKEEGIKEEDIISVTKEVNNLISRYSQYEVIYIEREEPLKSSIINKHCKCPDWQNEVPVIETALGIAARIGPLFQFRSLHYCPWCGKMLVPRG